MVQLSDSGVRFASSTLHARDRVGRQALAVSTPESMIAARGVVSEAVARAMAEGALARSRAQVAIAVTGIAGPGGGSAEKPVGLVWFGCARISGGTVSCSRVLPGGRGEVRGAAVGVALRMLLGG